MRNVLEGAKGVLFGEDAQDEEAAANQSGIGFLGASEGGLGSLRRSWGVEAGAGKRVRVRERAGRSIRRLSVSPENGIGTLSAGGWTTT